MKNHGKYLFALLLFTGCSTTEQATDNKVLYRREIQRSPNADLEFKVSANVPDGYGRFVLAAIENAWMPSFSKAKFSEGECIIKATIADTGRIEKLELLKNTAGEKFLKLCQDSILICDPFPPLPQRSRPRFDVEITFTATAKTPPLPSRPSAGLFRYLTAKTHYPSRPRASI